MLYLGADHAGFALKEKIKSVLTKKKVAFKDLGNAVYNKNDDYPIYAFKVAKAIKGDKGILFCGSAQGVCIVANKVKGIRAVAVSSVRDAKLSRLHNNANILCLAGREISLAKAQNIIHAFLSTPFSNASRHKRRLKEIERIEHGRKPQYS